MKSKAYYASSRPELAAFLPNRIGRLLDVGCSEGGFGSAVLERHPLAEVWGVEPNARAFGVAQKRLTKVIHSNFDSAIDLPDEHFDVITFNDSLEHMVDEFEALRIAVTKLQPGGTLICSVPNVRYFENLRELLIQADWRYVDAGILDRTHLRFFTKKSICRTIEECGLLIRHIDGINSHWWSGWKIGILKLMFRQHIEDMRWKQFVVVAIKPSIRDREKNQDRPTGLMDIANENNLATTFA